MEFYKYHNLRHFHYECPQLKNEANYVEMGEEEEEELLLMAYVEENKTTRTNAWFLDSGCSNHMCGDKDMFSSMEELYKHNVKCGNNSRISVAEKGSVRLMFDGATFHVQDVYYVLELRNNMLSVVKLQDKGLTIIIKDKA